MDISKHKLMAMPDGTKTLVPPRLVAEVKAAGWTDVEVLSEMTNDQIEKYAKDHGIDLGAATKKDDMIKVIEAAEAE